MEEKTFNPEDMPQEAFKQRAHFQHPQAADTGKPLNKDDRQDLPKTATDKEQDKTSKSEGLNEEKSAGTAGAFEGFEDQQNKV